MTVHTGIRAYAFQCTYNLSGWVDDPSALISAIQTALSGISNFSYEQLKIANVRNASKKEIEVEVVGITYLTKKRLTVSENDSLISDLETAFDTVTNFVYDHINIVNDIFLDDASSNWPGSSMQKDDSL
jgi:hypothetical protein